MGAAARAARMLTKGAPEVIEPLLGAVPVGYRATFKCVRSGVAARPHNGDVDDRELAESGARVLALATRKLPAEAARGDSRTLRRADWECDLEFAGCRGYARVDGTCAYSCAQVFSCWTAR